MNKVTLLGRLTKDPEIRYTQINNNMVATFTLAINCKLAKEGEEKQSDFFNIVAWSKLAETVSKYFKKGMQILIIGRLQTRTWENEQNIKHHVTEVICEEIEFVESKKTQEPNMNISNSTASNITNDITSEDIMSGDDLPF